MRVEEGPLRTYLQGHVAASYAAEQIATGVRERSDDAATNDFLSLFIKQIGEERGIVEDLLEGVDDGRAALQDVFASADGRVIGVHHNSAERGGTQLDVDCCIVFEVKDGRLIDGREFFGDLYAWDEFWS